MIRPSLEQAKSYSGDYTLVPVALEIFSDIRTPIEVLKILKANGRNPFILESVENAETWGRYTFLGYNPDESILEGNLRELVGRYKSPRIPGFPSFTGGFVGSFAFDYTASGRFCLKLYKQVIAFDHLKQKIFLITNIETDNLEENYINAITVLKDLESLIKRPHAEDTVSGKLSGEFTQSFSQEEFSGVVEKIQEYIAAGEVSQVVPSIKFTADFEGDLLQVYRNLRTINPSSYMFYMQFDNVEIAGASPETLVSLKDGIVSTYPLAGTCKRVEDEDENRKSIERLLSDPKELIEHEMLVELGKSDLAGVCESESVNVDEYRVIKTCSHVYHIESKVRGKIRSDKDAFDALEACLPAGTLCGAPRERSMEIIAEVEGQVRDIYGGALGYIDFTGEMDLCIGIRMAVLRDGKVSVQAGAGVVAESVPVNEYNECCNKARAMLEAIRQ
jgi:anthranilate synthase component 1